MSLRHVTTCHYHSQVRRRPNFSQKLVCIAALIGSFVYAIKAQKVEATPPPFNAAVYRVGERLTYNISFAQFVAAGHAELFVAARGTYFNRDGIDLRGHVETTGVVNVALLAINNDYETFVDPASGLPYRSQQIVRAAGRTSEAASDYNQPAGTDALPSQLRSEFPGTYDLLSAIYRVRAMPLTEGASFLISARHEADNYEAEVKVTGRALIKTNVGSFNTLVTRLNTKGHDYNIRIYFSDDEWHVPVLITAKPSAGEIRIELVASQLESARTQSTPIPQRPVPASPTPPAIANEGGNSGPSLNLPFKVGEQLNYQVYLASNPQPVGAITFAVRARGRYFNRDGLLFSATAQTNGAGARLFFVNDQLSSYVDPSTLLPFRTELNLAEGKWRTTRGYNLDQDRGAVTTDKRERIEIPVGTHDLISLIYAIRTFDLSPLKRNAISILAISQPRTLFVTSQRREIIELNGQKIPALLLTLTTDDPQSDRMELRMWVGDDARHLPLRISAVTPLGVAHADLAVVPVVSH